MAAISATTSARAPTRSPSTTGSAFWILPRPILNHVEPFRTGGIYPRFEKLAQGVFNLGRNRAANSSGLGAEYFTEPPRPVCPGGQGFWPKSALGDGTLFALLTRQTSSTVISKLIALVNGSKNPHKNQSPLYKELNHESPVQLSHWGHSRGGVFVLL